MGNAGNSNRGQKGIARQAAAERRFTEALEKAAGGKPLYEAMTSNAQSGAPGERTGRPPTPEEMARAHEEQHWRRLQGRKTLSPLNDGGSTGTRVRANHLGETRQRALHRCDLNEDSCDGRQPKPEGGRSLFDRIEDQRGINNFRWR